MKRIGVVVVAVALLPGCGLPIGVQMASLAVQGMSLAATGKTPTDHGISLLADKDCATWRPLTGEPICSSLPGEVGDVLVAEAAEPATDEAAVPAVSPSWALPDVAAAESTEKPAADPASFVTAAGLDEAPPAKAPVINPSVAKTSPVKVAPAVAVPPAGLYFVVGSFDTTSRANTLAGRHAALKPRVVQGEARGNTVYRVVVGPFAKSAQTAERRKLVAAGLADAWPLSATPAAVVPAEPVQVAEAVIGR